MNNNNSIFKKSNLVKKLSLQYISVNIIYFFLLLLMAISADAVLSREIWYEIDWRWKILHWLQDNIQLFFIIVFLCGWLFITLIFAVRMLIYLKHVVQAMEQLAMHSDNPIIMPASMKTIQDELNRVLEKSKRNEQLAKEAEKRKNDLIVYLAHDLKTPLTSVIGYLSLLAEEPSLPIKQRSRYTGIALEKAERLEGLINEFFDITRFNLSVMVIERQRVNLSVMMNQFTSEFLTVMEEKELVWELNIKDNVFITVDIDKMERVFDNLIRNAINYSYNKSAIKLELYEFDREIRIIVCNHGSTIAPEKISHIFEQFFRLDSSRTSSTGGAGLGLAITKEIVELHGGTITARSSNELICFTIILPK